jgi:hypothetical protein
LHDAVAGLAAQLRTNVPDHLEASTHILQHLSHIFAQRPQTLAAVGTSLMLRHVGVDLARKMLGQRPAKRLRRCGTLCGRNRLYLLDDGCDFKVFDLQLKLFDLSKHLLALPAEEHMLQLLDQQLEPFDLGSTRTESCYIALMLRLETILLREDHRLQRCRIESIQIGQAESREHERSMP